MVIECSHTFCKHCIEEWQKNFIEENPDEEPYPCPVCRAVFKTFYPNISVKKPGTGVGAIHGEELSIESITVDQVNNETHSINPEVDENTRPDLVETFNYQSHQDTPDLIGVSSPHQ